MTMLFLLLPCLVFADRFTEHFEKYVAGSAADPCQNFYSYMCPDNVDLSNALTVKTSDDFAEKLPLLIPEFYFRIIGSIEAAKVYDNRTNLDKGIERLIARCEDSPDFHALLEQYITNETNSGKFEECGRLAKRYLSYLLSDKIKRLEHEESTLKIYAETYAFNKYASNNSEVFESIQLSLKIYVIIQKYIYQEVQKSSWLNKKKNYILDLIDDMKIILPDFDTSYQIIVMFRDFLRDFTNCRKHFKGFTPYDYKLCISIAKKNYDNVKGKFEITDYFNAGYSTANMVMMNAFLYLLEDVSIETKAVIYSYIIGHEIAHGVFINTGHVQPKQKSCLIKNSKESCKLFSPKKRCGSGGYTYQEDAADWVGIHALLHLADHQLLRNTTQLPDHKTIFRIFGYLTCDKVDANDLQSEFRFPDIHSRWDIRPNAMLRQISKFQEEFGCKKGDPMVAQEKCFLTGKCSSKSMGTSIFDEFE